MKNQTITMAFFLAFFNISFGQTIRTVEVQFPNSSDSQIILDCFNDFRKIKPGDFYRIKVSGINQVNYIVVINQKDTLTTQELKLPAVSDFDLASITGSLSNINFGSLDGVISLFESTSEDEIGGDKVNISIGNTKSIVSIPKKDFLEKVIRAREILYNTQLTIKEVETDFNKDVRRIEDLYFEISNVRLKSKMPLKGTGNDKIEVNIDEKIIESKSINQAISVNSTKLSTLKTNFLGEFTMIENELKDELDKINLGIIKIPSHKESYEKLKTLFAELTKTKDSLLSNFTSMEQRISDSKNSVSSSNLEKALLPLIYIENLKNPDFYSLPIQYQGERSKVTVGISPRDSSFKLNNYSTSFIFPNQNIPYHGLSASIYYSGLKDQSYSFVGYNVTDTTINYNIKKENVQKGEVGTAILGKYGVKESDWFGYHGSLGFGISFTEKIRPRIMFGGGFSFGRKNSLTIDFGFASGYVERLSSIFADYETQVYTQKPESVTVSQLDIEGFISAGYFYRF